MQSGGVGVTGVGAYIQEPAPFQGVVYRVPKAHLSVLGTGEEQVPVGVRGQTPKLICVTLRE